ncbi:13633_t:CDS:2 [Acaulospora colombiana]|uniref:13633_t:CDS:1 n=1 Tax=Acaulospora colombiana TaxID=27376 RepID=A0ACA9N820_9GLOM|nr:13633_t:CDS:2 [Acaulospora colombiana]
MGVYCPWFHTIGHFRLFIRHRSEVQRGLIVFQYEANHPPNSISYILIAHMGTANNKWSNITGRPILKQDRSLTKSPVLGKRQTDDGNDKNLEKKEGRGAIERVNHGSKGVVTEIMKLVD